MRWSLFGRRVPARPAPRPSPRRASRSTRARCEPRHGRGRSSRPGGRSARRGAGARRCRPPPRRCCGGGDAALALALRRSSWACPPPGPAAGGGDRRSARPGAVADLAVDATDGAPACAGAADGDRRLYTSVAMKVGIIGLGYVGLPLAVAFAEAGADVIGVDADRRKVERLRRSESDIEDISSDRLRARRRIVHRDHRRTSTSADCDAILICVPTPLANQREPDLTYVVDAATALAGVLREGQLVVLESTTYPGTTRERLLPILEESGLEAGTRLPPRLLARAHRPRPHRPHDPDHAEGRRRAHRGLRASARVALYAQICDEVVAVSTPEAAELSKLLENIFRSVNIALVNELAMLSDRMGIDIWEVDRRRLDQAVRLHALRARARDGRPLPADRPVLPRLQGARVRLLPTEFVELAGKINQSQPHFCVEQGPARAQRRRQARQGLAGRSARASPTRPASATCASRRR